MATPDQEHIDGNEAALPRCGGSWQGNRQAGNCKAEDRGRGLQATMRGQEHSVEQAEAALHPGYLLSPREYTGSRGEDTAILLRRVPALATSSCPPAAPGHGPHHVAGGSGGTPACHASVANVSKCRSC